MGAPGKAVSSKKWLSRGAAGEGGRKKKQCRQGEYRVGGCNGEMREEAFRNGKKGERERGQR